MEKAAPAGWNSLSKKEAFIEPSTWDLEADCVTARINYADEYSLLHQHSPLSCTSFVFHTPLEISLLPILQMDKV